MARRNLASRADIPPDALRQRRDLYLFAIGLSLFELAGGNISAASNVGNLMRVTLDRPCVLLYAAWAGFVYFLWRFWLVSEARPFADYVEDVKWQAGDSMAMRRIAAKYTAATGPGDGRDANANRKRLMTKQGVVPKVGGRGFKPTFSLDNLHSKSTRGSPQAGVNCGPRNIDVNRADWLPYWWAWARAFPRAAIRERTFTDYTLPYLVAAATVVITIWRAWNSGGFPVCTF